MRADPFQLAGRPQSGLDLADGHRNALAMLAGSDKGAAAGRPGMLVAHELLVAELGAERGCGHGRFLGARAGTTTATGRSGGRPSKTSSDAEIT